MKTIIFLLFIIMSFYSIGQKKLEKEEQIRADDAPLQLKETIEPFLANADHIKFYRETDGDQMSYEVKFELNGLEYSVEFSDHLEFEDVEVVVDMKNIDSQTRKNIESYFDRYDKFRIRRAQKQFSSDTKQASQVIEIALENSGDAVTVRYELVVDLKQDKNWTREELLFDASGYFLTSREVIYRAEDFILYR